MNVGDFKLFTEEDINLSTMTVKELKGFLDGKNDNDKVYFSKPYSLDKYRIERVREYDSLHREGIIVLEGRF